MINNFRDVFAFNFTEKKLGDKGDFDHEVLSSLLLATIYKVRDGPLEKWWGGGVGGEKNKKKFMHGKMPRKKIHA